MVKVIVKPSNFDASLLLEFNQLLFEEQLAEFRPYFAQPRLVETHMYQTRPRKVKQSE